MSKKVIDLTFFNESEVQITRSPITPKNLLKGKPMQTTHDYYSSRDNKFFVGIWEAEVGAWTVNFTEHEFMQILEGVSIIRDTQGNERKLTAGDSFVVPAGFKGEWEVVESTKKIYAIYEPGE